MLTFTTAQFRYEPYPIGLATGVFNPADYEIFIRAYPREDLFKQLSGAYNKWSLSERNHPEIYQKIVTQHAAWRAFHKYVKGPQLLQDLFRCLAQAKIDPPKGTFSSRFEFSSLPAEKGGIEAHTDIPSKVLTLILPLVRPGEWDPAFGGGTDVLRPLDPWRPYQDYKEPRKAFDLVASYPYAPNQCVIFIKTFNSWHSVGPIQGPPGLWRRTLTLNVERTG